MIKNIFLLFSDALFDSFSIFYPIVFFNGIIEPKKIILTFIIAIKSIKNNC